MKILKSISVCLVSIHNRIYAQDCPTGGGPWSSQSTSYDDRYSNFVGIASNTSIVISYSCVIIISIII